MTAVGESNKGEQDLDIPPPSPVRHWRRRLRLPLMLLGPAIVVARTVPITTRNKVIEASTTKIVPTGVCNAVAAGSAATSPSA